MWALIPASTDTVVLVSILEVVGQVHGREKQRGLELLYSTGIIPLCSNLLAARTRSWPCRDGCRQAGVLGEKLSEPQSTTLTLPEPLADEFLESRGVSPHFKLIMDRSM